MKARLWRLSSAHQSALAATAPRGKITPSADQVAGVTVDVLIMGDGARPPPHWQRRRRSSPVAADPRQDGGCDPSGRMGPGQRPGAAAPPPTGAACRIPAVIPRVEDAPGRSLLGAHGSATFACASHQHTAIYHQSTPRPAAGDAGSRFLLHMVAGTPPARLDAALICGGTLRCCSGRFSGCRPIDRTAASPSSCQSARLHDDHCVH